jgi:hypothetical protein
MRMQPLVREMEANGWRLAQSLFYAGKGADPSAVPTLTPALCCSRTS